MYSNVQKMAHEKVVRLPEYSMKTGKLTLKTDQNQTLGGGESNRRMQKTLQSKILLWDITKIRELKMTKYSAENSCFNKALFMY